MKNFNTFIYFLLSFLFFQQNATAECTTAVNQSDSLALVNLYNVTNGNSWVVNNGWLTENVSEWYGVELDDNCRVVQLNLGSLLLTGVFPNLNLPELTHLELNNNQLFGLLPNFDNLTKLVSLQLADNNFNSTLPDFSNLPNLENINLRGNEFIGILPTYEALTNLKVLNLSDNSLIGEVTNLQLPALENLNLSNNSFEGALPNFDALNSLKELRVGQNELTALTDFSNLPNLETLYLDNNTISGNLIDFNNLGSLIQLNLSNNNINGNLLNFSNLANLESLNLSFNGLTGALIDFSNLLNLKSLDLSNNAFVGSLIDFNFLLNLENLNLSNNNLNGNIPDFSNLPTLIFLDISSNDIFSPIPNFSSLSSLQFMTLCPNNLIGGIPNFLNVPNLDIAFIDLECVKSAELTGQIFFDDNDNCTKETAETPLVNGVVMLNGGEQYAFTDSSGFYRFKVDVGYHVVEFFPPNYLWEQNCEPLSYVVETNSLTDIIPNLDFPNHAVSDCPLMRVDIGTPFLRRCFPNKHTVRYCNTGTATAENVSVKVVLPHNIIPLSASLPYAQKDSLLTFDIGTVAAGECGQFAIIDSVSCDTPLESTACVSAYIYPDTLCQVIEGTEWDGSNLRVYGYCLGDAVQFVIKNEGEGDANDVQYFIYEDDILNNVDFIIQIPTGDSAIVVKAVENGAAQRLIAWEHPDNPYEEEEHAVVEMCGTPPFSFGHVTTQLPKNNAAFADRSCQEIVGSFDPNDKMALPKGVKDEHYINPNTMLEYKIRFQNTGSDTAFRVVVVDTIDVEMLNMYSFSAGASSHPYEVTVDENKILTFTFNDILLPDSTTNEIESHGFVQFSIRQKDGNDDGEQIKNKAAIYFDYNEPIITNETFHTIGNLSYYTIKPIPIEYLYFEAKAEKERAISVNWATASEKNNRLFELERSTNGRDFEKIYEINGQDTKTTTTIYDYVDTALPANKNVFYYRLQQIDFDGKQTASNVVVVHIKNEAVAVNYDAFSQTLELQNLDFQNSISYSFTIYNLFGQKVYGPKNITENNILINGFEQKKGLYIYEISDGKTILASGKMMLTF
ncbi:MAG: DUF7619 domain-containing protein [Chitinophagales bacterium]